MKIKYGISVVFPKRPDIFKEADMRGALYKEETRLLHFPIWIKKKTVQDALCFSLSRRIE